MSIYRKSAATALAQYLLKRHGLGKIRDMIVHDIRQAQQRRDKPHIRTLLHLLHRFLKSHPEVCREPFLTSSLELNHE
jgi:phosphoglycolate phosphatase-like HAD superfamily hydrolase